MGAVDYNYSKEAAAAEIAEATARSWDVLVARVHSPIFFHKLANDYGIVPASDEERQALLEMAAVLQNAYAQDRVKSASAANSPIIGMLDELKNGLSQSGMYNHIDTRTSDEHMRKQAAYRLLQEDPELTEAAFNWAAFRQAQLTPNG